MNSLLSFVGTVALACRPVASTGGCCCAVLLWVEKCKSCRANLVSRCPNNSHTFLRIDVSDCHIFQHQNLSSGVLPTCRWPAFCSLILCFCWNHVCFFSSTATQLQRGGLCSHRALSVFVQGCRVVLTVIFPLRPSSSLCSTPSFLPPKIHLKSSDAWICRRLNFQRKYLGDLMPDPPWWYVVVHRHQRAPGCLPAGAQSRKQSSSVGMLGEESSFTLAKASSCYPR